MTTRAGSRPSSSKTPSCQRPTGERTPWVVTATPTNQVRAILEALAEAGILGIARREGNRRVYDLIERLFPAELLAQRPPERDQLRHRLLSRYRGHGLLGASGQQELWTSLGPNRASIRAELRHELVESGILAPLTVE